MFSASSLFLFVLSAAASCPGRGVLAVCRRAGTMASVLGRMLRASWTRTGRPEPRLCTCTGRAKPPIWIHTPRSRLARSWPFGIPVLLIPGRAAGRPARADPDAAGRADGLCRADRGDSFAGAAAGGTGELDHRRVRFHSEALRFHAAQHHLSRRGRRQGLDLRHLFAAPCQSQPYRIQRAVAVAVRQRAGAPVRRCQVLSSSWR